MSQKYMLYDEFHEITKSSHQIFVHYRHWFIYFTGVNLVAYGWFAQQLVENRSVAKWVILIICGLFLSLHTLAFLLSQQLINYFNCRHERQTKLLAHFNNLNQEHCYKTELACPINLYINVLQLAKITFPFMAILWVAFTIFAGTVVNHRIVLR